MTPRNSLWLTAHILCLVLVQAFAGICFAGTYGQGALTIIEPDGKPGQGCPLEHTSVKAEASGFVARVSVTQVFRNPGETKIEAVYTFPLSAKAAVDDMVMRVGDRTVRGLIKPREEARRIYDKAVEKGHVASLLDQERPNIFTQSVPNIMPGERVEITIRYVEVLDYEDGAFKFVFPMVVGPRFIPGKPTGAQGTGWSPDTTVVPDASRITPPVTPEGTRAGHDIDLTISIDAGVAISDVESKLHEVVVERTGQNQAVVSLKNKKEIPNRDFVLNYAVAGDDIKSGVLAHKQGKEGYSVVIIIPPKRVKPAQVAPKEMIFVIDCSGSQMGKPLEKAKETMKYFIERMNPDDTFNIVDFNTGVRMLFPEPKKNSEETRAKALKYLGTLEARGGTWMGPAVEAAASSKAPANRLRIVTFMTDGYVGNDFEILSMVKKLRGTSRWFPFGTGNSVNRFLLDNMARLGGGEVEYVLLNSPAQETAKAFYERVAAPILTDVSLSFDGIAAEDVFPGEISDLWSRKPLVFFARYSKPGKGTITVTGMSGGKPYKRTLDADLPETELKHDSLGSLWARAKVDALMDRDLTAAQRGTLNADVKDEIVRVALAHSLMTQFTSFVAVEEAVVTVDGKPTKVTVPVEMPDGVSREGVFGRDRSDAQPASMSVSGTVGRMARSKIRSVAEGFSERRSPGKGSLMVAAEAPAYAPVFKDEANVMEKESDVAQSADKQSPGEKSAVLKLAPELLALLLRKGTPEAGTHAGVEIKDGKINVQVWLNEVSDEAIAKLEQAGLRIAFKAQAGKTVIGTVDVEKLRDLALLKQVRFVKSFSGTQS